LHELLNRSIRQSQKVQWRSQTWASLILSPLPKLNLAASPNINKPEPI